MAALNSFAYLVYSLFTLVNHNRPTTDRTLNAWKISSEFPVTEAWDQHPHPFTGKYNEEDCPAGQRWLQCDGNPDCQETCENVGKLRPCPLVCVPGCVCEAGTVKGPDGKCISPSLCPKADVDPDDSKWAERDPVRPRGDGNCPSDEEWSECQAHCQHTCENVDDDTCTRMCVPGCVCKGPGNVRGPDGKCIPPPLCPGADEEAIAEDDNSNGCPHEYFLCDVYCSIHGFKKGKCDGNECKCSKGR